MIRLSRGKFVKKNEYWPQHITFLAILLGHLVFLPSPSIKCDSCVQTGFHSDPVPTAKSMYVWPCYLCMALFPSWLVPFVWCRNCLLGFPGGSVSIESTCNAGDLDSIPGLGRSPGGRHGNAPQYTCLENPQGERGLVGCSPWGHKESDMTEQQSTTHHIIVSDAVNCLLFQTLKVLVKLNWW